jgi:hypothetical protein
MTKPFNIHDWQAKQRLTEAGMDTPGGNPDYFYDKDSIFGKLKDDPNFIKKVNAKNSKKDVSESLNPEVSRSVDKFIRAMADKYDYSMQDAVYAVMAALKQRNYDGLEEHHNDEDFPGKDLSAWDLLDKIKQSNEDLYNKVEDFMKSMKENTTGTGASFSAGSGEGYMTPNAFKKKKK